MNNPNSKIIPLVSTQNFSAQTLNQVYCVANGSIIVGAVNGGSATLTMTAGQTFECLISQTTVSSGTFIGLQNPNNVSYLTNGQV